MQHWLQLCPAPWSCEAAADNVGLLIACTCLWLLHVHTVVCIQQPVDCTYTCCTIVCIQQPARACCRLLRCTVYLITDCGIGCTAYCCYLVVTWVCVFKTGETLCKGNTHTLPPAVRVSMSVAHVGLWLLSSWTSPKLAYMGRSSKRVL